MEPKQVRLRKFLAFALISVSVLAAAQPAAADAIRDREYWLTDYSFQKAWNLTRGEGVTVAVIDTGIDGNHPDLKGALIGGTDLSGLGSFNGRIPVGNSNFHGTLVASLIAGRGHGSSDGVLGTAPEAKILSASMAFGVEGLSTDSQVAEGIIWAVDHGADVINLSLSRNSEGWPVSWDKAFSYAFEHDVVVVAAAGNRASGLDYASAPATIPGVLAVAGVDRNGKVSQQASVDGLTIGVSAPATDLVGAAPNGEYKIWSGTSGAAPIVSGLVALVRSQFPELDAANVINRVISTAKKVTEENYSPKYGYGLIDPLRALTATVEPVTENPLGSLQEWIDLYRDTEPENADGGIAQPLPSDEPLETIAAPAPDYTNVLPLAIYVILAVLVIISVARRLRRNKSRLDR